MKRFIFFIAFIAALIISPAHSNAATINVISESCSVYGYTDNPPVEEVPYKVSGTTFAYGSGYWSGGSATIDIGQSTALGTAEYSGGSSSGLYGYSTASLSFSPSEDSYIDFFANFWFGFAGEADERVGLYDITTNEVLFELSLWELVFDPEFVMELRPRVSSGLIRVDSSHIYGVNVYVTSSWDYVYSQAELSLVAVPEPATMLLLGLGLMGLACVRKKIKN